MSQYLNYPEDYYLIFLNSFSDWLQRKIFTNTSETGVFEEHYYRVHKVGYIIHHGLKLRDLMHIKINEK